MAQGQLWYQTQGAGDDVRIVRVNNDGTNQTTVVDNSPAAFPTSFPTDIGLDTARGFYFAIFNDGPLTATSASIVRGSLTGGAPTTLVNFTQANTGGSPYDANPIVSALYVDPFSQRIFVGIQDQDGNDAGARSGIRSYSYDGAGNLTDNGFIVTSANSNKGTEVGAKLLDVNDFAFDRATNNLYFTETGSGSSGYTGLFRVTIGNPTSLIQIVSQTQFPDSGVNGFLRDVEIDAVRGSVFFSTYSQRPPGDAAYDANDNGVWRISAAGGADQTATRVTLIGAPANLYLDDMAFDAATNQLYIETGSNGSDDTILVFQLSADGLSGTLLRTITPAPFAGSAANLGGMTYADLPDVAAGATTGFTEGGARSQIFGNATIADADSQVRGATVQLTTNFNAATDTLNFTPQNGISGAYSNGTLTLSGVATAAQYQTAIRSVTFSASGDNPTNFDAATSRGVTVTIDDGSPGVPAGSTNTTTATFIVTGVNDAPVIVGIDNDTVNQVRGAAAVTVDQGGNAAVTDADSANFDTGSLTIAATQGNTAQTGDMLNFGGAFTVTGGNVVVYNGAQIATFTGRDTATLTFTFNANATPAIVGQLERAITFASTSNVGGTRTLTWTLNDGDGTANGGADTDTATSSVAYVVPAPSFSIGDVTAAEGTGGTTTFTFTVTMTGTADEPDRKSVV